MAGVDIVLIPYRGDAPALTDVLGGQVLIAVGGISAWIESIRAGKLRALAVASATRLDALPDVPTIGETVPGYEAGGWCGVAAPKNTPIEVIDKLNNEINLGLSIRRSGRDLLTLVLSRSPVLLRTSPNTLLMKPRSGTN